MLARPSCFDTLVLGDSRSNGWWIPSLTRTQYGCWDSVVHWDGYGSGAIDRRIPVRCLSQIIPNTRPVVAEDCGLDEWPFISNKPPRTVPDTRTIPAVAVLDVRRATGQGTVMESFHS